MRIPRRPAMIALLVLCLVFRTGFGLASNFWTEDERQIYLIGLQSFASHTWPYYGADVVWTGSRLPGALQGLLIAVPLAIAPVPESPFILLNLLTFGALAGFATYLSRRLPHLPRWLVWGWLMTAPWTLHFGTHIVNTSYQLPGAIAFFVGFFEATPALSAGLVSPVGAWALMGFGLSWMMQFHLSWVLLPAYMVFAFGTTLRRRLPNSGVATMLGGLAAGAILPLLLIVPTLLRGGGEGSGGVERNLDIQVQSLWTLITILAQFLSFASTEVSRFLGLDTAQRLMFLASHVWLTPLAVVLLAASVVQPLVLAFAGMKARLAQPEWPAVRWLAVGTVVWIFVSYTFSIRRPQAHAFYTVFPVATLFALYVWSFYVNRPAFRVAAAVLLTVNVAFHAGFALVKWPERSLYRDRTLVVHAIRQRNDRLIGERRASLTETAASSRRAQPDVEAASAAADLVVTDVRWFRAVLGRVSVFDVTIRNTGGAAAYLDLQYRTTYLDQSGREVGQSSGVIKEILQPGRERRWPRLVDGRADPAATRAVFQIVGAERVLPDP